MLKSSASQYPCATKETNFKEHSISKNIAFLFTMKSTVFVCDSHRKITPLAFKLNLQICFFCKEEVHEDLCKHIWKWRYQRIALISQDGTYMNLCGNTAIQKKKDYFIRWSKEDWRESDRGQEKELTPIKADSHLVLFKLYDQITTPSSLLTSLVFLFECTFPLKCVIRFKRAFLGFWNVCGLQYEYC